MVQTILSDRVGRVGAALVAVVFLFAVIGPLIAPYDPTLIHPDARLAPPSERFLLGADELGRDILSRAVNGGRVSLEVSLAVVGTAGLIGVALGMIAGYFRGRLDTTLMRVMDIIFAFPTLLLALASLPSWGRPS